MEKIKVWGIRWGFKIEIVFKWASEGATTYILKRSDSAFNWKTEVGKSENLAFKSRGEAVNHAVKVCEETLAVALENYRHRKSLLSQVRTMANEEN